MEILEILIRWHVLHSARSVSAERAHSIWVHRDLLLQNASKCFQYHQLVAKCCKSNCPTRILQGGHGWPRAPSPLLLLHELLVHHSFQRFPQQKSKPNTKDSNHVQTISSYFIYQMLGFVHESMVSLPQCFAHGSGRKSKPIKNSWEAISKWGEKHDTGVSLGWVQ